MKPRTIRAKFGDNARVERRAVGVRLVLTTSRSDPVGHRPSLFLTPAGARRLAAGLLAAADEEEA